jgi:ribosomal protein S18 acetylase RimI-like enzyme
MKLEIKEFDRTFSKEAASLFKQSYLEEVYAMPFLPKDEQMMQHINDSITELFEHGNGVMAFDDQKLIGYMVGWKVLQLFGPVKGIYSPMIGHSAIKEHRRLIYAKMLEYGMKSWVSHGYLSFATTILAHDKGLIDEFFVNGFGMRCMDSIRKSERIHSSMTDVSVLKATKEDLKDIASLHQRHNDYYGLSPIFMPRQTEDALTDLIEWFNEYNHHLWIAIKDHKAIGYIRIQPNGESVVSTHSQVQNITGLYVDEEVRSLGVASKLLDEVQHWLIEQGIHLCGVDFETINPAAYRFWNRYFTPYTVSVTRRIDERIAQ